MVEKFILDCSVAANWLIHDQDPESDKYAREIFKLLGSSQKIHAIVPHLWSYELVNTMALIERVKKIPNIEILDFLSMIEELPISLSQEFTFIPREILELANHYHLSAYDATYLHLAIRKGLPVATRDKKLIKAMEKAGIKLQEA